MENAQLAAKACKEPQVVRKRKHGQAERLSVAGHAYLLQVRQRGEMSEVDRVVVASDILPVTKKINAKFTTTKKYFILFLHL